MITSCLSRRSSDQRVQLSADSRSAVSEVEFGDSEYPPLHGNYDGTVWTKCYSTLYPHPPIPKKLEMLCKSYLKTECDHLLINFDMLL